VKQLAVRFADLSSKIGRIANDYPAVKDHLAILGMEPIKIALPAMTVRARVFAQVIAMHREIIHCEESWMNVRLVEVDLGELNSQVGTLNADYGRMKAEVADILADSEQAKLLGEHNSGALTVLLAKPDALVAIFNRVLPVVNALRSEGMRRRRWKDLLSGVDAQTTEEELREKLLVRDLAHMSMVAQGEWRGIF